MEGTREITEVQIQKWKNQYGRLIKAVDEANENKAYLKFPSLEMLDVYSKNNKEDAYLAFQELFESCVL